MCCPSGANATLLISSAGPSSFLISPTGTGAVETTVVPVVRSATWSRRFCALVRLRPLSWPMALSYQNAARACRPVLVGVERLGDERQRHLQQRLAALLGVGRLGRLCQDRRLAVQGVDRVLPGDGVDRVERQARVAAPGRQVARFLQEDVAQR